MIELLQQMSDMSVKTPITRVITVGKYSKLTQRRIVQEQYHRQALGLIDQLYLAHIFSPASWFTRKPYLTEQMLVNNFLNFVTILHKIIKYRYYVFLLTL